MQNIEIKCMFFYSILQFQDECHTKKCLLHHLWTSSVVVPFSSSSFPPPPHPPLRQLHICLSNLGLHKAYCCRSNAWSDFIYLTIFCICIAKWYIIIISLSDNFIFSQFPPPLFWVLKFFQLFRIASYIYIYIYHFLKHTLHFLNWPCYYQQNHSKFYYLHSHKKDSFSFLEICFLLHDTMFLGLLMLCLLDFQCIRREKLCIDT